MLRGNRPTVDPLLGRIVRASRFRPQPPRELRYENGVLSWLPPQSPSGITHWRIYLNSDADAGLVRELPFGQLYLADNISGNNIFVSSYNYLFNKESPRVPLSQTSLTIGPVSPFWRIAIDTRSPLATGVDLTATHARVNLATGRSALIERIVATLKTPATGANLVADVLRSDDNGATWDPITTSGITVLATSKFAELLSFSITTLNPGDLLRYDLLQVGSTFAGGGLEIWVGCRVQ